MTHDEALAVCHAGPKVVAKILCDLSDTIESQQVELIEVPLIKEEHRSYPVWCAKCGKIHYMPFPPEVYKEGLFKERLTSLVAYMKNVCHTSFSTIRKYIKDVLGEKVSRISA